MIDVLIIKKEERDNNRAPPANKSFVNFKSVCLSVHDIGHHSIPIFYVRKIITLNATSMFH